MNINLANIDFCPGGKSATLTETTAEILLSETEKVIVPPEGTDGFNKVTITHAPVEESVSATITENGTHTIAPSEGFGAMFGVNVDVNVTTPVEVFTDVAGMKYSYSTITEFPSNFQFASRSGNTDCVSMFSGCKSITSIPLFDTQQVTNMYNMFNNCGNLTSVPLFDTSKVTDMNHMFNGCTSLTSIPLFDTSKVTNMSNMFAGCYNLTSIPLFDTSKVTDMNHMFSNCFYRTSIPQFDTRSVTNMENMFFSCPYLTSIPQLDTHSVTTMRYMFAGCTSLTSVPRLDATSLTDATYMFGQNYTILDKFTDFGGLTNLKIYFNLSPCPNLTHDSLMNVINEAADVTSSPKKMTLGSTNLAKLTDEDKAIATNKGWTLQ